MYCYCCINTWLVINSPTMQNKQYWGFYDYCTAVAVVYTKAYVPHHPEKIQRMDVSTLNDTCHSRRVAATGWGGGGPTAEAPNLDIIKSLYLEQYKYHIIRYGYKLRLHVLRNGP